MTLQPPAATIRQDEVLTGEAVALDIQPLSLFQRALGTLIDVVATVLVLLGLALVAGWLLGESIVDPSTAPIFGVVALVIALVIAPTAIETLTGGRSLGRLAVGGRIVRTDGGSAGLRQAFIRAFIGVFEIWFTFGAVAALVGAFTPRTQRLGDLVAGTYCERTRAAKLSGRVPELPPALAGWATVADVGRMPDRLARRVTQFVHHAHALEPAARVRVASALAAELTPYVSPLPTTDPESFVLAVSVMRRERELRALQSQNARLAALTGGDSGSA